MSTANLSDQMKHVNSGLDLSVHSFFNAVAATIQKKIEKDAGIKLSLQNKAVTGKGKISAVLIGQTIDADPKEIERTEERVRKIMQDLKNPVNLLDMLK